MQLNRLGDWAADDAADAKWGRPIDFVDLNDSGADDRLHLRDGIAEGDRVVASFGPGSRRPHRAHGMLTPRQFADGWKMGRR
jgi:hypothetical protein